MPGLYRSVTRLDAAFKFACGWYVFVYGLRKLCTDFHFCLNFQPILTWSKGSHDSARMVHGSVLIRFQVPTGMFSCMGWESLLEFFLCCCIFYPKLSKTSFEKFANLKPVFRRIHTHNTITRNFYKIVRNES